MLTLAELGLKNHLIKSQLWVTAYDNFLKERQLHVNIKCITRLIWGEETESKEKELPMSLVFAIYSPAQEYDMAKSHKPQRKTVPHQWAKRSSLQEAKDCGVGEGTVWGPES